MSNFAARWPELPAIIDKATTTKYNQAATKAGLTGDKRIEPAHRALTSLDARAIDRYQAMIARAKGMAKKDQLREGDDIAYVQSGYTKILSWAADELRRAADTLIRSATTVSRPSQTQRLDSATVNLITALSTGGWLKKPGKIDKQAARILLSMGPGILEALGLDRDELYAQVNPQVVKVQDGLTDIANILLARADELDELSDWTYPADWPRMVATPPPESAPPVEANYLA